MVHTSYHLHTSGSVREVVEWCMIIMFFCSPLWHVIRSFRVNFRSEASYTHVLFRHYNAGRMRRRRVFVVVHTNLSIRRKIENLIHAAEWHSGPGSTTACILYRSVTLFRSLRIKVIILSNNSNLLLSRTPAPTYIAWIRAEWIRYTDFYVRYRLSSVHKNSR